MNPLVASAIIIFAVYIISVAIYFFLCHKEHVTTNIAIKAYELRERLSDDESEPPEWADKVKWRESLK